MPRRADHAPSGHPISLSPEGALRVPSEPIVPFIEGDGCGADVWRAARRVMDEAVARAYGGQRRIAWLETLAGQRAFREMGEWLPQETVAAFRRYLCGIRGPLATPVGAGIRSLGVSLRRKLDLYAVVRPIRWLPGAPSPLREPALLDLVLFREGVEDVHTGVEWPAGSEEAARVIRFLQEEMGVRSLRFPDTSAIGVQPTSRQGVERLVRAAMDHALAQGRRSLTLVHHGAVMRCTEGAFKDWAYDVARVEYRDLMLTEREAAVLGSRTRHPEWTVAERARALVPAYDLEPPDVQAALRAEVESALALCHTLSSSEPEGLLRVQDLAVDAALQQILTRPRDFDVLVTLNLSGDHLAAALAALVGGSPMVPGASVNYVTGHALFEAQHGPALRHAGQDSANPTSLLLAGQMLLDHLGWSEAAERMRWGVTAAVGARVVTGDLARRLPDATAVSCSAFAEAVLDAMDEGPPTLPRPTSEVPPVP